MKERFYQITLSLILIVLIIDLLRNIQHTEKPEPIKTGHREKTFQEYERDYADSISRANMAWATANWMKWRSRWHKYGKISDYDSCRKYGLMVDSLDQKEDYNPDTIPERYK